jgi:hypothetical protein
MADEMEITPNYTIPALPAFPAVAPLVHAPPAGMVQANVGQKRLKRHILRRFFYRGHTLANCHLNDA